METIDSMTNEIDYLCNELTKLDTSYPNLYETVISVIDRVSDIYMNIFEVVFEMK